MAITRSQLGRGPAYVTFGGATLFTRDDLIPKHSPVWEPVVSSLHGQIDKYSKGLAIKLNLTLFGNWSNLSVLFPSYLLAPTVGTRIYGDTDSNLVIQARDGTNMTYYNAQITKLADLYLGVDSELWAAAVEITAILANSTNPEAASAYFSRGATTYSETTFTNNASFLKCRWSANWGGYASFASFVGQKGFHLSWQCDVKPDIVDGYGQVSAYIGPGGLIAQCKCIPIGPTMADIDAAQGLVTTATPPGQAPGALLSSIQKQLTMTASIGTHSVVLTQAALVETGTAFGVDPLRQAEVTFESLHAISSGVAQAVATVT
jgi:hypothetical protein